MRDRHSATARAPGCAVCWSANLRWRAALRGGSVWSQPCEHTSLLVVVRGRVLPNDPRIIQPGSFRTTGTGSLGIGGALAR